jgi:hypothetical protein
MPGQKDGCVDVEEDSTFHGQHMTSAVIKTGEEGMTNSLYRR